MSGPIRSAARNGFVCSVGSAFSYIKNQKCANPQFRTYAFLQHDPMHLCAAGGYARKKTHDGSAIGFTQKRHTLYRLLYRIFHRSASSSFGGGSRSGATCMSRRLPAAGGGSKRCFPNGGRERHALPMERLFASKGPQRAGAPFADFPYALVGVPPVFGAPVRRSALPVSPLLCRAARDGCARVRLRDGVSQCRLYIIMYSWAVESKALWKTVPRHACHSPAPPEVLR